MTYRNKKAPAANGHAGKSAMPNLLLEPASKRARSDDPWAELIRLLDSLFPGDETARNLSPDDSDDIRSEVLVRILTIVLDNRFHIRTSLEVWLRTLVRNEIRDFLNQRTDQPKTITADPQYLAQLAIDPDGATDGHHEVHRSTGSVARHQTLRPMLQAIETVRRKVSKESWDLFVDVVVNESDIKAAAFRHGKSYAAAQKTCKRLQRMLREQASAQEPE